MGKTVFDKDKIQLRLEQLQKRQDDVKRGIWVFEKDDKKMPVLGSQKFLNIADGTIRIYQEPMPKYPYVMAIDTAGEGSDYYAAHVMNNITGEQVAVFHSNKNPDECVYQCYFLALYYNTALIAPEVNFDTWIIKFLTMMKYRRIYIRMTKDDKRRVEKDDKLGFRTQPDNRQAMLTDMVNWTGEHMELINDADTLNEMLVFTRQEKRLKGIWWGAEPGEHDDKVIAFAILLQARIQQSCALGAEISELKGVYLREEIEDMVDMGTISRKTALDYVAKHGYYGEKEERIERGNRYARR
jgi:hypothetical protein